MTLSAECPKTQALPFNALSRLDGKPGGIGEFSLPFIEGEEHLRPAFERYGNVEQIDGALAFRGRVFFAQLIRAPKALRPMNLRMHEQPIAQVLFDLPERGRAFRLRHISGGGRITQGIAHLDSM